MLRGPCIEQSKMLPLLVVCTLKYLSLVRPTSLVKAWKPRTLWVTLRACVRRIGCLALVILVVMKLLKWCLTVLVTCRNMVVCRSVSQLF